MRRAFAFLAAMACGAFAADPAFEVASVHTRTDGTGDVFTMKPFRFEFSGPRLTIENFRLRDLITYAYDIKDYELFGEPRWADIDRYNISAQAPDGASLTRASGRPMMRALLADRFQLKVHTEMKELPVYELVVAKGGSKLRESPPGAERLLTLGSQGRTSIMSVTAGDMGQLAGQFSKMNNVDRPVIDKTGLAGLYDYKLQWGDDAGAAADLGVVSIFTAFQQQLGLRLEPASEVLPVLIVEHTEKPSEN